MKVRRKEVLDCFYLTKDNVDEFVKWCWEYIRLCEFPSGNDFEYNIIKNDRGFYIDWATCGIKCYFAYNWYYVIEQEYKVVPYTKKEFEEEFEVVK